MRYEDKLVKDVLQMGNKYQDHFGVEIEAEGDSLPRIDTVIWKSEADQSLRGESYEYVLKRPLKLTGVASALTALKDAWVQNGSRIKNSPNAGVHVHVNCGDLTVKQLFNLISAYLVVEELLIKECGDDRIGNLFCLRSSDAEFLIDMLAIAIRTQNLRVLHTDDLRYASMNVKALGDYGSVEFRAWRSDGDLDKVYWWTSLLAHLKDFARIVDNPSQIIADASEQGSRGIYEMIMGEFVQDLPWNDAYEDIIYNGVRRVQQFAYAGNW